MFSLFQHCLVLSSLLLTKGSRLGSPKDDNVKGKSWAFQDKNGHHEPPGTFTAAKKSDTFEHAWDGEGKEPKWQRQMPKSVGMPMSIGGEARKALQPRKDEEMKPDMVAKYDAKAKVSTSTDLQGTLEQDCQASLTLKEFMPTCLKHTKSLIADLDANYGDAQLETILLNWCRSAEEFPHARGSQKVIGFRDHQTCKSFASDLKEARYLELKSTSDKGYQDFCTAFYGHHGGFEFQPKPPVKEEPPKKSGSCWMGLSVVVASLMLSLFGDA